MQPFISRGVDSLLPLDVKIEREYDPLWPNDYEKVVKEMREAAAAKRTSEDPVEDRWEETVCDVCKNISFHFSGTRTLLVGTRRGGTWCRAWARPGRGSRQPRATHRYNSGLEEKYFWSFCP